MDIDHGSRRWLRLSYLLWLAAPVLLWWALKDVPWREIAATLRLLKLAQIVVLLLVNAVILATFGGRLWLILRAQAQPLPLLTLLKYWLAGFAISYFTPGPQFGGGPFQIYLLQRNHEISLPVATAAVATSKLLERIGNAIFLLFGLLVLLRFHLFSTQASGTLTLLLLVLLALPVAYWLALWRGRRPLLAGLRLLPERLARRWGWQKFSKVAEDVEGQVATFCQQAPLVLVMGLMLTLFSWILVLIETWLALVFLGVRVEPLQVVGIVAAAQLAFLTPLPAGLGALEAAMVFTLRGLGYPPAHGASLALLVRVRDVTLGGLGLWLGGWMIRDWREVEVVSGRDGHLFDSDSVPEQPLKS